MSTATDAVEEARLKELLRGYLTHVPPAVNNGSYNISVDFKAKVNKAKKTLLKRGVSHSELRGAINDLDRFWKT